MKKELKDGGYFIPRISENANTKPGTPEITLVLVNEKKREAGNCLC